MIMMRPFIVAFFIFFGCSNIGFGQSCGVWTATTTSQLNQAVSDACAAGGGTIKVAAGTYVLSNPLVLCSDITIEGGYDSVFVTKTSLPGTTTIFRDTNNVQSLPSSGRLVAVEANTQSNFNLYDLTIQVDNAPAASLEGISTYALHLASCSGYQISRCQFISGNASVGATGLVGAFINSTGGAGGAGGSQGADCNGSGTAGVGGLTGSSGSGGVGGAGGAGGPGDGCNWYGCNASESDGSPGSNGSAGTNGSTWAPGDKPATNTITGSYFIPNGQSAIGGDATGGGGGGGGGGGAIGTCCLCSCGSGNAFGGAGGDGGNAGTGGIGGYGGGGSFSVFLFSNVSGTFTDCDLQAGALGAGGDGGAGQTGEPGFAGLAGGFHSRCSDTYGGNGGNGGNGGDGGRGRDGADGVASKLYNDGISPTFMVNGSSVSLSAGFNSTTDFGLSAQAVINVDNIACTNANVTFSSGASQTWDLGTGSTPQTPTGDTVATVYSLTNRKDITFGTDVYRGFLNITDSGIIAVLTPTGNIEICGVDSVLLTGNSGFASYQWQFDSVDIPGATSSTLYATAAGSYTFIGTTSCCGPSDTSAAAITTIVTQPTADAGTGGSECDLDFAFNAVPSFGNGAWAVFSGPGTGVFGDTVSPGDSVTVSGYGTYVFMWTETNSTCSDSDTVSVNFYEQPVANAGLGGVECDTSFVLNATASAGTGTWSQLSGPGITSYSNANSATTITSVSAYGTYIYQWLELNGVCSDSDTVSVVYNELPAPIAESGGVQCDLDFDLSVTTTNIGTGTWTQTLGLGVSLFTDPGSAATVVSVSSSGAYEFTWTEVNGLCSASVSVVVIFSDPVIAYAGLDVSVSMGNSVVLTGQGGISYQWTPDSTLDNPNVASPIANPLVSATYILTATDNSGCTGVDTVRVEVLEDFNFVISSLMTPNGDGFNDTWYIDNIEYYPDCKISIYNRYGNLIFSKTGYQNDWKGEDYPDGTYYYVIDCPGDTEARKGGITIFRRN